MQFSMPSTRRGSRAKMTATLLSIAIALLLSPPAKADSLYPTDRSRSMFADRKARGVGDVITVLIAESTVAVEDAQSEAQRSLDAKARGGTGFFGIFKLVPKATLGGETSHKGSGSSSRSSK